MLWGRRPFLVLAILVLAAATPFPALALDAKEALKVSQAALGRTVGDYTFRDTKGRSVALESFRGKPLVVNFVYTSCSQSCPVIVNTLADAAEVAWDAIGDDGFNVLTIGFDAANDLPERMRLFRSKQGIRYDNWTFLSGDLPAILGLAEDLGFQFYKSPNGFDHLDQVSVIDGDGKVFRQVYGESFEPPLLVEPLKDLVFGTSTPFASLDDLVRKVRLFCTIYDPAAGRYRFDYSLFYQIFVGAVVITGIITFLVKELWWNRRRRRNSRRDGFPRAQ